LAAARELLSSKEVAGILGVSTVWLYRRRNEIGTGPDWFFYGNKKIVYRKDDVERWLESKRNATQSA
jgi:predicted DNA-binding transcriptional regulator AlpA